MSFILFCVVDHCIDDVLFLKLIMRFYFICLFVSVFFFQAEDGIRDLVRSRGLGDVYKRQT